MLELHPPLSLSTLEDHMVLIEGGIMEIQGVNIQLDDFELCRYLVSQQLWKEVMGSYLTEIRFKNHHRLVENVSWDDIQNKFLPVLQEKTGDPIWGLPTEAQWEYAARGGKYAIDYTYPGSDQLKEVGWFNKNSYRETNPIACKRPQFTWTI
ncbi:MAG: SUMF1/EgtB/PvdO family nonheme iron enzyme [Bacteroidota bacterium]